MTELRREFANAPLQDGRLRRRLADVAESAAASPSASLPDIARSSAELKALYRFLSNKAVTPAAILEPHMVQTTERVEAAGEVVVAHDTSELRFSGETTREGLGHLNGSAEQGFLLHCSLAVAGDSSRRPLGVIASQTWARTTRTSRQADGRPRTGGDYHLGGPNEGERWLAQVLAVEERIGSVNPVHVMDREADAFPLLVALDGAKHRFVIRMSRDRKVNDECGEVDGSASEHLVSFPNLVSLEVPLSRRRSKPAPRSPKGRDARTALLSVSVGRIILRRPNYIRDGVEDLPINVVCVTERNPPKDTEAVAWVLMTSEPVATRHDALRVIEFYRTRWLIEELFKALKTGCSIEKRQLESYEGLTNALALFLPIAWQLLLLRSMERTETTAAASVALTLVQIEILRARVPKFPAQPTVADALRGVAYMGGHFVKTPPGWLVLGRGLVKLLDIESGVLLARALTAPSDMGND